MIEIAGELRRLRSISPSETAHLHAWHEATVPTFHTWMQQRYPDMHLPKIVMFYLLDADVRLRDAEYRRAQDDAMDALIAELEAGHLPDAPRNSGCAFPMTWIVAGAVIVLMAILR